MPTYDVECSECGYDSTIIVTLAELSTWDRAATCPSCHGGSTVFRRVIKQAPTRLGGGAIPYRSKHSHGLSSGERDTMRHRQAERADHDKVAAARESVRKGEFEGF